MISYGHTNASNKIPFLTMEQDAIYLALTQGGPLPKAPPHLRYLAQDLEVVAQRLLCDDVTLLLQRQFGVVCRSGVTDRRMPEVHIVAVCVVFIESFQVVAILDAEAAIRVAARLASGLALSEALSRTLEQCERPIYTEAQIQELEKAADAYERRLNAGISPEQADAAIRH